MLNFRKAALCFAVGSSFILTGCAKSGFEGDPSKAGDSTPHYVVDKITGLCFSEKGDVNNASYSHTWVPCTLKVIEQLPPDVRESADRTTGITYSAACPR